MQQSAKDGANQINIIFHIRNDTTRTSECALTIDIRSNSFVLAHALLKLVEAWNSSKGLETPL